MAMGDTKKLVFAIIKFLRSEIGNGILPADGCEGLEVSIQCLESAYNITPNDTSLDVSTPLLQIFQDYLVASEKPVSPEDKATAEKLKNEGNSLMSQQDFGEAVECYTKAIALDPKNAVFYCNRAAAHSKLNNFDLAIKDCNTALQIDPSYSKAYGRLGLAYSSLNRHQDAWNSYKRALDLEPDNDSYRNNLQLTEDKLAAEGRRHGNIDPNMVLLNSGLGDIAEGRNAGPGGNLDLGMLIVNPEFSNMASQMLTNPSIRTMVNNLMSGSFSQNGGSHIDALLQAGQELAQRLHSENPALVEQLRRQFGNENQPPPPPPPPQPPSNDGENDGSS